MKGAILFSVCRGSCSEGMNFKNDFARLVIVVGIPYAYLGDPKTQLRKEYQDEFNKFYFSFIKDKKIKKLSGAEWYSQNAIKCVNQAIGRVIRHSADYGCMLLIDTRYQQNSNKLLISKWTRDLCIVYSKSNND
jgi:Rad3-related DNA helicase